MTRGQQLTNWPTPFTIHCVHLIVMIYQLYQSIVFWVSTMSNVAMVERRTSSSVSRTKNRLLSLQWPPCESIVYVKETPFDLRISLILIMHVFHSLFSTVSCFHISKTLQTLITPSCQELSHKIVGDKTRNMWMDLSVSSAQIRII